VEREVSSSVYRSFSSDYVSRCKGKGAYGVRPHLENQVSEVQDQQEDCDSVRHGQ
jgi:hypothetical protein